VTDETKLLPEYLYLWSLCERTIRAVNAASTGSAAVSRNRFREEFFLEFDIPLPSLDGQWAIVSAWEQAKAEIACIHRRLSELEEQIEVDFLAALGLSKPERATLPKVFGIGWRDLDRWSVMYNQLTSISVDIAAGKYPVCVLGEIATVSYGNSTFTSAESGTSETTYVSAQVSLLENDISNEEFARSLATKIADNYPDALNKDVIQINLIYGYDIGIASRWNSHSHRFSPTEL